MTTARTSELVGSWNMGDGERDVVALGQFGGGKQKGYISSCSSRTTVTNYRNLNSGVAAALSVRGSATAHQGRGEWELDVR